MPNKAKAFIVAVIVLGLAAFIQAAATWETVPSLGRMALYTALTAAASMVRLRLPGLEGTYSLNGILVLAGAVYFTLPEAVLAAAAGALVQSLAGTRRRPTAFQILFNVANESFSIAVACAALSYLVGHGILPSRPALLAGAAAIYFVLNTGLVSGILTLLGGGPFLEVNRQWYAWSFPYYMLGAAVVGVLPLDGRPFDLEAWAVLFPLAYLSHFFCGLAERGWTKADAEESATASIPASAVAFTAVVAAVAGSFLVFAATRAETIEWPWLLCYLALAVMTATWKVRLPGTTGTISVHYVVMLVAVAHAGLIEALAIAAAGPLVQSFWKAKSRPQPVQVVFNVATMVVATGITYTICRILAGESLQASLLAFLAAAAILHFLTNTLLVSAVISLVEKEKVFGLWRRMYVWSFPIYMVGAAAAAVMIATTRGAGWLPSLLILPLMAMAQLSYRLHLEGQPDRVS